MRLFTWLGRSPLWLGKEAGGQVGRQPLSVFAAPVGVRGDRKALHLKLPQIGRGGRQAGGGPMGPDKGEPPTCLYLPETTLPELGATVNGSYWDFSVRAGMEWGVVNSGSQRTQMAEQEGDRAGLRGWSWGPSRDAGPTGTETGNDVEREDSDGGGRDRNRQRQEQAT